MTAWLAVVSPMCLASKCCVDFIALEYGSRFQFVTDGQIQLVCCAMCVYALLVDCVNFFRWRR